jgi:putative endonuclease
MTNRRRAERKGRTAELIAALFLILKGYRPVAWRVKTPRGEII